MFNMRSFKTKIRRLLFVVVLILATVFSTNLNTNLASALNISQESLTVSDQSSTITIHDAGIGNFKITPNLEFNRLDDFITYKLVIKNNDGKRYKIVSITDDNTNNAIELSYIYDSSMNTNNKEIDLTIKYVQVSQNPLNTVTATIKLIDEDDDSQNIPIVVPNTSYTTPNTGANTITDTGSAAKTANTNIYIIYTILAGIVIAIYIIIRRKYLRNNKSRRNLRIATLSILLLGLIPVIVIAASSQDLQFIIDFSNVQFNGPYTVTFNTNGGAPVPNTETINHGETVAKPTDPNKTGYTFSKWLNGTSEYNFATPVTSNLDLTAEYNVINYSISYELNGGTVTTPNPTTYNIETPDFTLENPSKPHFDFTGWTDENNTALGTSVTISQGTTGNKTYTANFAPIPKYTVSFDTNGGTPVPAAVTVERGETISRPTTDPSKHGYNFDKWVDENGQEFDFSTSITEARTITAKYTPIPYTITYNLNGGGFGLNMPVRTYTIETRSFILLRPVKTNNMFLGWTGDNGTTPEINVQIPQGSTGDRTYTANFAEYYTVTFDATQLGSVYPTTKQVPKNTAVGALPTPTALKGFEFTGWEVNGTKIDETYTVNSDVTATATYGVISYIFSQDPNGGMINGSTDVYVRNYNVFTTMLSTTTPTRDGYVFKGWTGTGITTPQPTVTITVGSIGDRYYTAQWAKIHTVTFDAGNGTVSPTTITRENGATIGNLPTPTPPNGHNFIGWFVGNTQIDQNFLVKSDLVVTAKYKLQPGVNIYNVVFDIGDGTMNPLPSDRTVVENNPIGPLPAAPTPPAEHKFEGWYVGDTKIDEDYLITGDTLVKAGYVYVTLAEEVESLEGEDVTDPGCTVAGKQGGVTKLDDPFGNVRYVGACPSNYVWYNCSVEPTGDNFDYENNCERWRIIGTFKDVDNGTGVAESRIRIVRDKSLGEYSWDSNGTSSFGINQWGPSRYTNNNNPYEGADLFLELNGDYLDYSKTGTTTWYNGRNVKNGVYDYSNSLTEYAQSLIDNTKWYTAPLNMTITAPGFGTTLASLTARQGYINERSIYVSTSDEDSTNVERTNNAVAKVGLINPSDYAYSTSGGSYGRTACLTGNKWIANSNPSWNAECYNNSWIFYMKGNRPAWTINRAFQDGDQYAVYWLGWGASNGMMASTFAYSAAQVFPSVFLDGDVRVTGGAGTHANPFTVDHKKVQIKNN